MNYKETAANRKRQMNFWTYNEEKILNKFETHKAHWRQEEQNKTSRNFFGMSVKGLGNNYQNGNSRII